MSGFWRRRIPFAIILVFLGLAGLYISHSRGHNSPPIPSHGGEPFHNFATLEAPFYVQDDIRWKDETLGGTGEKVGDAGCTLCSIAMALAHFGYSCTPTELNEALKTNGGYTWRGLIKWDAISKVTGGKIVTEVLSKPSLTDIDTALKSNQPVLAKVLVVNGESHWVLILGKEGADYLTHDPLGDGHNLEPLSKYDSDIFGVRIIRQASQ